MSAATPAGAAPWRLITGDGGPALQPARGTRNMAVDEALFSSVQEGAPPAVRFYLWEPACLSFGRNQAAAGIYDAAAIAVRGIDVVRRPTGGLAVLHDRELTYSVVAPAGLLGGPRAAYNMINRILVAGLRSFGVHATLAGSEGHAPAPSDLYPCFQGPAPGEVMAGGGKLVGSAQCCERRTILQHGSILIGGDQSDIVALQVNGSKPDGEGVAAGAGVTLETISGTTLAPESLMSALASAFDRELGTPLAPGTLSDGELALVSSLEAKYASDAWTWRR